MKAIASPLAVLTWKLSRCSIISQGGDSLRGSVMRGTISSLVDYSIALTQTSATMPTLPPWPTLRRHFYSSSLALNQVSSGTVPFSNSPIISISSAVSCTNFAGRRSIIACSTSSRPNQTGSANFTGSREISCWLRYFVSRHQRSRDGVGNLDFGGEDEPGYRLPHHK